MPPAAASYEDIYHQTTGGRGADASSLAYLPDYLMFLDIPQQLQQRRRSDLKPTVGELEQLQQQHHHHQHHLHRRRQQHQHQHRQQLQQSHRQQQQHQQSSIAGSTNSSGLNSSTSTYQQLTKSTPHQAAASSPFAKKYQQQSRHQQYADIEPLMLTIYGNQQQQQRHFQGYEDDDDEPTDFLSMTPPTQHYLTLEELKSARNSCWLCGCNWLQDHVSLDCPECGGYGLTRPCPSCEGQCKQIWKRNVNATHDHHKALWVGQCTLGTAAGVSEHHRQTSATTNTAVGVAKSPSGKIQTLLPLPASSCCSSQPSSAASSDCESESAGPTQQQHQQQQHHHHQKPGGAC